MNKKIFYFCGLLIASLILGSCAEDDKPDSVSNKKNVLVGTTVFSSQPEPETRTSATYTGSGLDFYWTTGDKIWVKDDNGNYNQNSKDDIDERIAAVPGSRTTDKAKFWMNGSYTSTTHQVRYTGRNGIKDKVTIKATQQQYNPGDAEHITRDGDFGVATASKVGSTYNFTLDHKAAYITFMPYSNQNAIKNAFITKIRVFTENTSDALAGTFDLADDGTLSNPTGTSNNVELILAGSFSIPNTSTYTTNGAVMVINPGTYNNLNIEYTLEDPQTQVKGTIIKKYPSVTFYAGSNKPVRPNLQVPVYRGDIYYMWDAQQQYWSGYEWDSPNHIQPALPNIAGSNYPQNDTDPRYYNKSSEGWNPGPVPEAKYTATNCPNINELCWYLQKGEPYRDNMLWASMEHLYANGIWLKKPYVIAQENGKTENDLKQKAPDGTDYRLATHLLEFSNNNVAIGRPTNLNDYMFLPSFGSYLNGTLSEPSTIGWYWSSSIAFRGPNFAQGAYFLGFDTSAAPTTVTVKSYASSVGAVLLDFFDKFRPNGL